MSAHWMDHLKFGGSSPTFDVIERAKEYVDASAKSGGVATDWHADDYVFRGSVVGPITGKDVAETQKGFNLLGAYPDIDRGVYGFTPDPQNPYRVFWFERWTGTMTGTITIGSVVKLPPTQRKVETPLHVTAVVFNPEGKVVYETISPPLDRFEGNTKGAGAVFGLLAGAGLQLPSSVGDALLVAQQKLNTDVLGGIFGKTWSDQKDIPAWWKSKARGGENNDI